MLVCLFTASSMMHILLAMLLLSKVSKRVHTHRPQRCRCMGGHEGTSAGHGGHEVCFMRSWGHGAWKGTGHVVLHAHCPVLQPMTAMHTTPEVSHPRHPGPARADLALLHAQGAWGIHRGMHRGHGGACTGGMGHGACTTGTFTPQSSLYPAFTPPLPPSFAPSNLIRSTLSSTLSSTLAGVPPPCDFPTITSATAGYKRGGCGGNRGGCRGHKGGYSSAQARYP